MMRLDSNLFWILLTELVSYMYPIYVHYMYILDVLSFPFGSSTDLTEIAKSGLKVSEE